jgi:23S rRNA pseudouridine1911/1915/1917 synthase
VNDEFVAAGEGVLDEVAAGQWEFFTIGQIRRAIESGAIALNGQRAGRGASVKEGDVISLDRSAAGLEEIAPVDAPLAVLFEDDALIAVDKPPGVAVVPERGSSEWVFMGVLLYHSRACLLCKGRARFRIVHRLDRDTSGAVVVAKTLDAARALTASFEGREVEKRYVALVAGEPSADGGVIDAPIGPLGRGKALMAVVRSGKPSVTEWRVLERFRGYALLDVRPRTGRTHQIRVHLAHAGLRLAVDAMYGGARELLLSSFKRGYKRAGEERPLIDRLTLHCAGLEFAHPVTGEATKVEAPLPEDFERALKALRKWARE